MTKKKLWLLVGGMLIIVLLIGTVGVIAVNAQTPAPHSNLGQGKWPNRPGKGMQLPQAELDAAAKALGMTSADLSAELKSGKTLSAIAAEKGVDIKTVQAAIQTARVEEFRAQINQAVSAGKMSQDKANWLLEGLDKGYINGPGLGFGFFGGMGFQRNSAGGPQGKKQPQPTAAPGRG